MLWSNNIDLLRLCFHNICTWMRHFRTYYFMCVMSDIEGFHVWRIKLKETTPSSHAIHSTEEASSFHRLFASFHASVKGFEQGWYHFLFLNIRPLNSKYLFFLQTAADGDDDIFSVVFSIVDAETNNSWHFFLRWQHQCSLLRLRLQKICKDDAKQSYCLLLSPSLIRWTIWFLVLSDNRWAISLIKGYF